MSNEGEQAPFMEPGTSKQYVVVLVNEDHETSKLQHHRTAALVTSITSLMFCACCCMFSAPAIILTLVPKLKTPNWPAKRALKFYRAAIILASIALTLGTLLYFSVQFPFVREKIVGAVLVVLHSFGLNVVGA